ncbi:hypothetical protein [Streptococcus equi]|uniref:hypothetical protein n=2 Tax=Streptococcus equi TaxID=1336 RepID=UPI00031C1AD5|nr:hypothetical protein [Streptococcus equi]AIA68108.1 hypothetical protein Q426_07750 [Streptococcus equi subsp. zooepidemicus CY]
MTTMTTTKQSKTTLAARYLKLGLTSAMFAGGAFLALGSAPAVSASTHAGNDQPATQRLTDQEIYERAQQLELPDYVRGSIYGILNQNSSVTYPKDIAGLEQSEAPQPPAAPQLTDQDAQQLDLPDYVGGSVYGILNQNSSITYPKDIAGLEQSEAPQPPAAPQLTDQEIYERAQKLDLPDYVRGSIYGILNQNSSITYPRDY